VPPAASEAGDAAPALRLRRVLLGFFLLWCAANAPALRHAWWHVDDFCQDFSGIGVAHNLGLGRPGQFLVVATFALEDKGRHPAANIALRLFQGGLHSLAAALLAAMLYERTRRRATALAALPFLLCPFAVEPTVWRSGIGYALAAVLSLLGLRLMAARRVAGSALVVVAILTQPLAAFAAAAAWCLCASLSVLDQGAAAFRRLRAEGISLAIAYGAGVAATLAVAATQEMAWRARLDLASEWGERLRVLADANTIFLSQSFVAQWKGVGRLHTLFPLLALLPPAWFALRGQPRLRLWGASALLLSQLVVPYAPLLPVGENYLPDRLFYLAPLLHCGAWAVADQAWREVRSLRTLASGLLVALCLGYACVTWTIAPVFDEVYQADLRLLRDLEGQARASGAESLFVCAREVTANPNPHAIDFRGGPSRASAFLTEWSAEGILEWHSTLPVTKDQGLRGDCCVHCDWTRSPSFHAMRLPEGPVYCGCAP
jgi:hypothetical protein